MAQVDPPSSPTAAEDTSADAAGSISRTFGKRHDPYAVLRHRDYRKYLLAGMIASVGGQVLGVAIGWELYERTRSATALGLVGLAQVLPVLVLAIPAGHAADRFNRKHQIIVAHALLGLSALGLAGWSQWSGPIGLAYFCLVVAGIGQAINMPARWALLPQIVPRVDITSAVTWNSSCWQVASVIGPALGGGIIAFAEGATRAYVFAAIASAIVILLVAPIQPRPYVRDFEPLSRESLLAGLRFVFRTELILATITLDMLAVLLAGATALLPIFARDILAIGPAGLGWLRAAPSLGALATALFLAHRPPMRRSGLTLLWAVAGFGAATVVFGLSTSPLLSFLMLLLTGAFDNVSVVVRQTLVQILTPDAMRGRVSAINAIFIGSSNELGEFESGITAHWLGAVRAVVLGGIGSIFIVLGVAYGWPAVRRLGTLHEAGQVPKAEVK